MPITANQDCAAARGTRCVKKCARDKGRLFASDRNNAAISGKVRDGDRPSDIHATVASSVYGDGIATHSAGISNKSKNAVFAYQS